MYKDMIVLANTALKNAKGKLTDEDKQFVVFFAYKTGDMKQMQRLIKELQEAKNPAELEEIKQRYKKLLNLSGGIEELAEELLVCIERYRLEQEHAIGYLEATLKLNGIQISDAEIRNTDLLELKDKIAKEAAR